jgi:hypothetical protein
MRRDTYDLNKALLYFITDADLFTTCMLVERRNAINMMV